MCFAAEKYSIFLQTWRVNRQVCIQVERQERDVVTWDPYLQVSVVTVAERVHSCRHKLRVTSEHKGSRVGKVAMGPVQGGLQPMWEAKGLTEHDLAYVV